ncbi:MAG TPA: protein ndvB, partial [Pyrinomonadaceae bacterium]
AVQLAEAARNSETHDDDALSHVGFYLIDDGLVQLEKAFAYRMKIGERARRWMLRRPAAAYMSALLSLTALILAALVFYGVRAGSPAWLIALLVALSLIPASELALGALNWSITHLLPPRLLPKIDTSKGVPDEGRTMIVVPTLFTSPEAVGEMFDKLEVHFLANQEERFYFALLGDFADAPAAEMPGDAELLDNALERLERLNARYRSGGEDDEPRFHLFHRRRQWNEGEGQWLGWERKRGKLQEFNRLLRGARDTSFIVSTAGGSLLAGVRYVITLDSDTQLPREAARKLVGIILHPLNRAQFDARAQRVKRGYGILQPRVGVTLESATRSTFARIFSGNPGIDPYTSAASDVYQDLFAEGSFTGKGLYDVDVFEAALAGRVPDNALLSHDLFEGLYARCALVTDIELLDDYPGRYDTYAKRQHRWTRGDWQIARWLMPRVPDASGRTARNRLPLISRWKIFDNLRRSLVAPSIVLWLAAACLIFPGSVALWMLFIILTLAFPVYAHATTNLFSRPRAVPWPSHLSSLWSDARTNIAQAALMFVMLAHQAYMMLDAITRTLYRKLISHKRLLEWMTAAQAETGSSHDAAAFLRFMWPVELIVAVLAALLLWLRPAAISVAAPFLLAWAVSPLVAYLVSRRAAQTRITLDETERRAARLIARRTWRFFEEFVGEEDNWLPPDNFQEDPQPLIAHRTSPTNIGLLLLSTVAAHDFGYVSTL